MDIQNIAIGGCIRLGVFRKRGEKTPSPMDWRKVSNQNLFYLPTGIGSLVADAIEPDNESRDRRDRGSNFFPQLNVCQYLNADDLNWFKPAHETDVMDYRYGNLPGFLSAFDDWEKKLIIPQEITIQVPGGFKRKYGEVTKATVKVSIPSRSQIYGEDATEGEQLELFKVESPRYLLTRTAINTGLVAVDENRRIKSVSPCNTYNISPLIKLDGDCTVEYDEDDCTFYPIPPKEVIEQFTNELHKLWE